MSEQPKVLHRLRLLLSYPFRRADNWSRPCGCRFYATALGWKGIKCMDHWLD